MAFEVLTSALEHLSAAPLALPFQSMPFLLQRFASANLPASHLLLTLCASLPTFLRRRRVTGSSDEQNEPNCGCKQSSAHFHVTSIDARFIYLSRAVRLLALDDWQ